MAVSHQNEYTMATISHRDSTTKLGSNRLSSATKLRRNLTEVHSKTIFSLLFCIFRLGTFLSYYSVAQAEKEAQRLRRILANRESARQTVRRRQVAYSATLL